MSRVDDRQSRLSLPHNKVVDALGESAKSRSETLPPAFENAAPGLMLPGEAKVLLQNSPESEYLVLDVRVATLYAQSRIRGALNLCIPTTLLKRATFNLEKLEKTLQTEEDQAQFRRWRDVKYLVIYDNSSTEKRDAVAVMNMFKKFMAEGFCGRACLLKGGFQAFAAAYPSYIDHQSAAERGGTSVASSQGGRPSFAPVIGGVAMPSTANHPNPFFSNIRQNMDLADGVGQMDISVPSSLDSGVLPSWLREATLRADHGKKVSDRFLKIERNEQSRMRDAYSSFSAPTPFGSNSGKVQLCGVEKGVKNRYKDILPFEHARVRLTGQGAGSCDYINASHVQASRSHKRYIASQGPLPATFEVR
jgi:protein-tyrosine phosphatase